MSRSAGGYLLDTHVVLWLLAGSSAVPAEVLDELSDPGTAVLVSAVVPWEVVVKRALGKLRAPDDLVAQVERAGLSPLPITLEHGAAVGELPPLHRDPFDRMLVAQARTEGLTLLTADRRLPEYDVDIRLL
ncbi:MAG: type II toxin-antitoxin system VapC family toxin [Actinomycetota bacterium]